MHAQGAEFLEFADFALDIERVSLHRNGQKIDLRPKSFDLLRHLVENPGRVISKDELVQTVWRGGVATDESLARCVSDVRAALDDSAQLLIETIPRRGYVFKAAIKRTRRARPVEAAAPAIGAGPGMRDGRFARIGTRLNRFHAVALLVAVVAVTAIGLGILSLRRPAGLELPARPSIVVLPFTNLSDERRWDYFVDGFSEDIATGLSRYSQLFVIARETALAYRAANPDMRQISRELGVQYVLKGEFRRNAERVRISAQLVDGLSGRYLWADQFDKPVDEVFSIQDDIIGRIVATLVASIDRATIEAARRKQPANLGAYELYLQGRELRRTSAKSNVMLAEKLFENAITLDPDFAPAYAELAFVQYFFIATQADPPRRGEFLEKGLAYARKAFALSPSLPFASLALGDLLMRAHDFDEAQKWAKKAIELGPGEAENYAALANILSIVGRSSEAIPLMETAIRYDPIRPPLYELYLGRAYALTGQFDKALPYAQSCVDRTPEFWPCLTVLVISLAHLDRVAEAQAALRQLQKFNAISSIGQYIRQSDFQAGPELDRIVAGFRKAGLPD